MPRARNKPKLFQTTDTGPDTPAQQYGAIYVRPKDARAGDVRKLREHPLERMAKRRAITDEEKERGLRAVDLYHATLRSRPQTVVFIDGSADPGAASVFACTAQLDYAKAVQNIPARTRRVFNHIVEEGRHMISLRGCRTNHAERQRQLKLFRHALDKLEV